MRDLPGSRMIYCLRSPFAIPGLNEVRKDELLAKGYIPIISEAPGAQVDIFEKSIGSRFTFLQGHPE